MMLQSRGWYDYFGDYFVDLYASAGYRPWVSHRIGNTYDPLLGYYRWSHRDDPSWYRNLDALYTGRARGDIERPARTLVQQNTLIQNITNNVTNVNKTVNITNLTAIAPI